MDTLGTDIDFNSDKWLCDKKKRTFTEDNYFVTIYFTKVSPKHKDMVKYFAILRLLKGTSIRAVKSNIFFVSEFINYVNGKLDVDYNTAIQYKKYLDSLGLSETTLYGKWNSVNKFFEVMNGYDGFKFKMVFAENPYNSHKKLDYKYIPNTVTEQLDRVFYSESIDDTIRCVYWVLRLIPSRVSEVLNMTIDCIKPFDGHYCLFIPTWKQNGGRKAPIMRCIHINDDGIGSMLIGLIKKQQKYAQELQQYMPDNKKNALFTFQSKLYRNNGDVDYRNIYTVMTWPNLSSRLKTICKNFNIRDGNGSIYNLTTHQFRHNGITDRLERGFTVEQITDITGHHGSTMLLDTYSHLNLKPETIIKAQGAVLDEIEKDFTTFNGKVLNLDDETETEIMKNIRAHKVRGGICSDITGCKSDMMGCLECEFFVPDPKQKVYYEDQINLWEEKAEKFCAIPIIRGNAKKNVELYKTIVNKMDKFS